MPVAFPRLDAVHQHPASFRDPESFVGNGAYVLDEWRIGSHLRLRRNPAYRLQDRTAIEFVEYFPIEDPATEYNRYRTGELDITATIPPAVFSSVREERPQEVHVSPGLAVYYLAYDLSEAPQSSLQLRKALSLAIDRAALIELLGRGEYPAFSLVPPRVSGHRSAEYAWKNLSSDDRIAAARGAYSAAGFSSDKPLAITLTYDAGDVHEKVALVVSSMWQDVLDVDVTLEKLEWKIFLDTRADRAAWQVMRFAWFGDYDDASTFTNIFRADSPQNLPGYRSSPFEASIRLADELNDPIQRQTALFDAERVLLDDYPIVPLYFYVNKHLVNSRIKGYAPNVLDRHPTRTLSLD
jgi:oligopeptide transport system substrate-binding protein